MREIPRLRERYDLDFLAINGENAAGGFGITEAICDELLAAGADVVTLETTLGPEGSWCSLSGQDRLLRRSTTRGGHQAKAAGLYRARNGADVLVINAMGLIFMPELDCPSAPRKRRWKRVA